MTTGVRVAVVGGGIGGMAAALLLSRASARVTLVERVAEPAPVGAAIALFPNGLAVLYGLGLRDPLQGRAYVASSGGLRLGSRRRTVHAALPDFGDGLDHALGVTRAHLLDVLDAAVRADPGIEVRFGTEVVGAHRDGRIDLRPAAADRGETLEADLIVGADGIGSVVRGAGDFGARRSMTPGLTIRALVEGEPFPPEVGEFWSAYGIAMGVPVGGGESYLALSASRGPAKDAMERRDLPALRAVGAAMLPGGAKALSAVESFDELIVTPIETVACRRWVDGRLVLLGDAAHAMAPHLAQGANSALLDAFALTEELSRSGATIENALAAYEARRRRTAGRLRRLAEAYRLASESATVPGVRQIRDMLMSVAAKAPKATDRYMRFVQQEDPAAIQAAVRSLGRT
ncbi:FAD-dependent oxidoreductase [Spirillospora sp. NPDC048911]|uniref:FAD-dependent oxidoreductase n=1 Tax=Spirillospora sp. NPDC048911 TaxID=3364527 RepID=UPI00371C3AA8